MKRTSAGNEESKHRRGGITWDESNLEENERIKKELNPRKIDEPKTPYLSPHTTEDEADEVLHDTHSMPDPSHLSTQVRPIITRRSAWSDSSNGGSPSPRRNQINIDNGVRRSASRSPRFSEEYYRGLSDDEEDPMDSNKAEKRRKFKEARKAHYEMKAAMSKAKELMRGDGEDDETLAEEEELALMQQQENGGY